MRFERSYTFRRARRATIALATAAMIATSEDARARWPDEPALDVPFVPTPPEVIDRMMDIASIGARDVVIDLGSGDGRVAIAAARRGARARGIDLDPERIREAQENARAERVQDRVRFEHGDLFATKLGDATVVTMFLTTRVNLELRARMLTDLRPGARIVSHMFDMGDWRPDARVRVGRRDVFMWIVPANAAGHWQGAAGSRTIELNLRQNFQFLTGCAQIDGKVVALRVGSLQGNEIHLQLSDGTHMDGRILGDCIAFVSGSRHKNVEWRAVRST